ncbi:signal peptidase I [Nocardioides jishulii]|uniref:Signal peptidase I n=1 Tax=Nocardioides jishulii TaxID=2575440 RepID=A0A4U2YWR2_9ACTN|nr:signal peptidase I [Nocardioides jishulii]QCX28496.1 signal peptidase I [Nocardioides jishulii]TKI64611.1 signal peptidase I [Nocardioides jishulii]
MSRPLTAVRTVAGWLANLLLVAVVLGCAAYVAPGLFGYERYVITGGSMSGTFEKGSLAFEKRVPVAELEVGDVITYLPPADSGVSTLVTHRITSIEPGEDGTRVMQTQGDANPDPDPWEFSLTAPTQPVVAQTVPHLGHVFIALANPQVRVLVIGGPAALIALLALRDLIVALRSHTPPSRPHTPGTGGRIPGQAAGGVSPA